MGTVTVLSSSKVLELIDATIISGVIDGVGDLILTKKNGTTINLGNVNLIPEENTVRILDASTYAETSLPSAYPTGMSVMAVSSAQTTASWTTFTGTVGSLLTVRNGITDEAVQYWRRVHTTGTNPEQWVRASNSSGWSSWKKIALTEDIPLLASNAEAETGTDTTKTVTPSGLSAFLTARLASNAETQAGTSTTKAITPASLSSVLTSTYRYVQTVKITSSGTFSKASYPNMKAVIVRLVGGGGAGGGSAAASTGEHTSGGGGGGGGYAEAFVLESALAASETVTIGAGGAGSSGAAGGTGGTTSFGTHVVAAGGTGGATISSTPNHISAIGGTGGAGTTGDFTTVGCAGGVGSGAGNFGLGAQGGPSLLGGGAPASTTSAAGSSNAGDSASGYGGGGGGGMTTTGGPATSGGNGAPGIVLVEVYA